MSSPGQPRPDVFPVHAFLLQWICSHSGSVRRGQVGAAGQAGGSFCLQWMGLPQWGRPGRAGWGTVGQGKAGSGWVGRVFSGAPRRQNPKSHTGQTAGVRQGLERLRGTRAGQQADRRLRSAAPDENTGQQITRARIAYQVHQAVV